MAKKEKKQPRVSQKAKKNFTVFIIGAAVVFGLIIWNLFGGQSDEKVANETAKSDLTQAGTSKVDKAEVDRTDSLSTIQDKDYLEQLREAEEKRKNEATNTSDDSYMSDVSMYEWQEVPEGSHNSNKSAENNTSQTDGTKNNGRPDYQELARKARENQSSQSNAQQPPAQPGRLTLEQRRRLVQSKVAAIESMMKNTFSQAPASNQWDYTKNEDGEQQQPSTSQMASGNNSAPENSESNYEGSGEGTIKPGVLPGDRFVGYTKTAVNTDTTTWVEVEISQGPLKGAIVGLKPQRVEGEVVLLSQNITLNRSTSSFKAIALNPNVDLEPAFSTETNMRYLARFGAATASAVLDTVSELIGRQQSSTVNQDGFATQSVEFSNKEIAVAAGAAGGAEIGRMISEEARKIEPQVKVKAGHRVVLAVTSPQAISWMPEPYTIKSEN